MKIGYAAVLSLLVLLAGLLAPAPARANVEPVDCSKGCHLITCNEQNCSLWRCDNGGCRHLASWPREWSVDPLTAHGRVANDKAPAIAYAKVCAPRRGCDLWQLGGERPVLVGTFDNIDDAVRQPVIGEPARRRR